MNSRIMNDIGSNSLLGKRNKIAKFLMRTFTYRSTFLYAGSYTTGFAENPFLLEVSFTCAFSAGTIYGGLEPSKNRIAVPARRAT